MVHSVFSAITIANWDHASPMPPRNS